jgi:hypothetical protein
MALIQEGWAITKERTCGGFVWLMVMRSPEPNKAKVLRVGNKNCARGLLFYLLSIILQ